MQKTHIESGIVEMGFRRVDMIADAAVTARRVIFDEQGNGGRLIVIAAKTSFVACYLCIDAYAVGNLRRFGTEAEAVAWCEEILSALDCE